MKTVKLLEENTGQNLHDTEFGNDFLHITPKEKTIMRKIDKSDFIKIYI